MESREISISPIFALLPEDIINQHILPYAYMPQPKSLLRDIRTFKSDYDIARTVYNDWDGNSPFMEELFLFLQPRPPNVFDFLTYFHLQTQKHREILQRLFISSSFSESKMTDITHSMTMNNTNRNCKAFFALMTHEERTGFLNKFVFLEDQEIHVFHAEEPNEFQNSP